MMIISLKIHCSGLYFVFVGVRLAHFRNFKEQFLVLIQQYDHAAHPYCIMWTNDQGSANKATGCQMEMKEI